MPNDRLDMCGCRAVETSMSLVTAVGRAGVATMNVALALVWIGLAVLILRRHRMLVQPAAREIREETA